MKTDEIITVCIASVCMYAACCFIPVILWAVFGFKDSELSQRQAAWMLILWPLTTLAMLLIVGYRVARFIARELFYMPREFYTACVKMTKH